MKKDYYKKIKDADWWQYEDSYQDEDVFEDNGREYTGPVRKKANSDIDFKDYDEGPKEALDYLQARDVIANIVELHKISNCNIKFETDPENDKDMFRVTCNDFIFTDDDTEKDYKTKSNDVVKLIRKEFKKETGKTLKAKELTHSFTTQQYQNRYGDLPLPGADVQVNVHQKNRSYVTYTCTYEYSL
mgnify:FL=1